MAWKELSRPGCLERGEVAGEDEKKREEGTVNRRAPARCRSRLHGPDCPAASWPSASARDPRAGPCPQVSPGAAAASPAASPTEGPTSPLPSRSLGVHFSKVRSLTLDSWEPELVKVTWDAVRVWGGVRAGLQSPEGSDTHPHPPRLSLPLPGPPEAHV